MHLIYVRVRKSFNTEILNDTTHNISETLEIRAALLHTLPHAHYTEREHDSQRRLHGSMTGSVCVTHTEHGMCAKVHCI